MHSFLLPILWHVPKNGVNTCPPVSEWNILLLRNYFPIIIISFKRLPQKRFMPLYCKRLVNPESRLLRWGHPINTSVFPLPFFFFITSRTPSSLFKNSSAPPPLKLSAPSPITRDSSRLCKWLPSPRSPRYANLNPLSAPLLYLSICDYSWFSPFSAIISRPLEIRSSSLCPSNLAWSAWVLWAIQIQPI